MNNTGEVPKAQKSINLSADSPSQWPPEKIQLRCSNFRSFMEQANTLKAKAVNMRKYKLMLGSHYQELVSTEDVADMLHDIKKKIGTNSNAWKQWSRSDILVMLWLMERYNVLFKKIQEQYGRDDWERLAGMLPGKTSEQCMFKWLSLFKNPLQKNPWTEEEDQLLKKLVAAAGSKIDWQEISQTLFLSISKEPTFRTGKQCKEHYSYHLDPNIRKGHWTTEEDVKLIKLHLTQGKKWQRIASMMNGRTENSVKNRINVIMDKYVLPLLPPNVSLEQKVAAYLKEAEGNKVDEDSIKEPQSTTIVTSPHLKKEETPVLLRQDLAQSTDARVEDQNFHTYATRDQRRNIRLVTFAQLSVEEILKEPSILSAIYYTDTKTVMHKEIALVQKKSGQLDYQSDELERLIDFQSIGE